MNEKKICFISCVNNEVLYKENVDSINRIKIPKGYELETIGIRGADSIASGYNKAMYMSDAKYKVYTHQDVVMLNEDIISEILGVFKNDSIGIIGVIGGKGIPYSGVWNEGLPLYGRTSDMYYGRVIDNKAREPINEYEEVALLDGLMLITQYDIHWREDIFTGWHFYDASQCTEMRLAGKKVVVPRQEKVWVHHNNQGGHASGFEDDKEAFIKEYRSGEGRESNKVSIILVTYNKLQYNKECIESIRTYTKSSQYELIVVDNNSTDGTREWLTEQSDIKLALNDKNEGFIRGCNVGIQLARKDNDILLLNNDTVVTPKWLENLKECLDSNENIGIVGPMTNYSISEQVVQRNYNTIDEMIKFAANYNTSSGEGWEEKIFLMGFCILVKRKAFEKAGLYLDELFSPGYYEDNDLCIRINQQGYKAYLCRNTFIHHYGSVSFKEMDGTNILMENSRWKFYHKWGFDSYSEPVIRGELICNIYEPQDKELNLFQYNCGLGCDLLKLKMFFQKAKLYGVEKNQALARVSKNFVNIATTDMEDLIKEYPDVKFDYVILGDINEDYLGFHELIKNVDQYVKSGGYIIAATKNLLHFCVVRDYINENITREKLNTIYKTLYTKEELIKVFSDNGYTTIGINNSNIYGNEEDHNFISNLTSYSIDKSPDKYLAYKYVGKFQKSKS